MFDSMGNVHDTSSSLSSLIEKVLHGEQVIISHNNRPVAELVPIKKSPRIPGQLKGKIKYIEPLEMSDKDINQLFEESEIFPK